MEKPKLRTDLDHPISIRRPAGSLSRDMPRHWNGGDAFATHFLNALSSTFPFGEAFFIRSVRHYQAQIRDPRLRERVRGFTGQEAQHSRVHADHVEILIEQGYTALAVRNRVADRVMRWYNRRLPVFSLVITAALEHMTALLARQMLLDPLLRTGQMHPEMSRLWRWHALEEAEHKSVAFDVLMEVSPSHWLRVYVMISTLILLSIAILDRMIYMLWKDGLLFRGQTWLSGWQFLFGPTGFLRGMGPNFRSWFRREFHPDEIDDRPLIEQHAPLIVAEIANRISD
jgi:predicted metal-dependent hydrolase